MSTFALLLIALVALVVGWITTLSLVRDVRRLECRDFLIAASGAFCSAFLVLPRLGIAVWGDYGLRLPAIGAMAIAAVAALMLANLVRWRGLRAGKLRLSAVMLPQVALSAARIER
jgi:hypothetical protein